VSTPTEPAAKAARSAHMRHLVDQLRRLETRLRAGGGAAKIERQHKAGKMTARERLAALLDPGTPFLEIGLLLAYDQYNGEGPGLGTVTGIGRIEGRYAVLIKLRPCFSMRSDAISKRPPILPMSAASSTAARPIRLCGLGQDARRKARWTSAGSESFRKYFAGYR
jgi:acetyl-CoA carboxylase carboxyltransferase component